MSGSLFVLHIYFDLIQCDSFFLLIMFYFVIFYCYLFEAFLLSNETESEWIQMGGEVGKKRED